MERFGSISPLREYLAEKRLRGKTVSFVPTMGALHEGHRACISLARRSGDVLVVSVFVNPTQFVPGEDYEAYPRCPEGDFAFLEGCKCDVVFTPSVRDMYPKRQEVWVEVEGYSVPLCGRDRPGHFRGVATVVAKLFHIVQPDVAVFGQKDAQQAIVIKEMVEQLDFPVKILVSPTVRDKDGLAVSSRNSYLSSEQRERAAGIYRSLRYGWELLDSGERDPLVVTREIRRKLEDLGIDRIDYVELLSAGNLSPLRRAEGKILIALAARIGETRLIDNIVLEVAEGSGAVEAKLF